jgi:hypothetical protein
MQDIIPLSQNFQRIEASRDCWYFLARIFGNNHTLRIDDVICFENNSDNILKIDLKYAYK